MFKNSDVDFLDKMPFSSSNKYFFFINSMKKFNNEVHMPS